MAVNVTTFGSFQQKKKGGKDLLSLRIPPCFSNWSRLRSYTLKIHLHDGNVLHLLHRSFWQSFSANYRTKKSNPCTKIAGVLSFSTFKTKIFQRQNFWFPFLLVSTNIPDLHHSSQDFYSSCSRETFLPTSLKNIVNQALSVSVTCLKCICIKDLPILAASYLNPFPGMAIHQVFFILPKSAFSPFSMDSFLFRILDLNLEF